MGKSINKHIQTLHFTSWLFKDVFWCLKWKLLATLMIGPTLFLTIYILVTEKENRDANITLMSWVLMNVFWMSHELHNTPIWFVYIPISIGVFNTVRLLFKK